VVAESEIHDASADADQEHSRCEVTVRVPLPPEEGTSGVLFATETSHRLPEGPVTLVCATDPPHAALIAASMNRATAEHVRSNRLETHMMSSTR